MASLVATKYEKGTLGLKRDSARAALLTSSIVTPVSSALGPVFDTESLILNFFCWS